MEISKAIELLAEMLLERAAESDNFCAHCPTRRLEHSPYFVHLINDFAPNHINEKRSLQKTKTQRTVKSHTIT